MPYVNKVTLRQEFDHLKMEFERLSAADKVTPESRVLINALLMLFEVMIGIFLEKTTKKDAKNSSKPSSQIEKDESASVAGTHGKGLSENGERFSNSRSVEVVEVAAVDVCASCGEDLHQTVSSAHERRTQIDIVFEKVVTHIDAEIKTCPNCQSTTKGEFPEDMSGPLQYGLGVKAYVLN